MKTIEEIENELLQLRKQIRLKIIGIIKQSGSNSVYIRPEDCDEAAFVYYSDEDNCAYEGEVTSVTYDETNDMLTLSVDNPENPVELDENQYLYATRSHEWLIDILRNICIMLNLDINTLDFE